MCHRKFNANTLLLMRFLCINVAILLPSRAEPKVYCLFLFTLSPLLYSGELKIYRRSSAVVLQYLSIWFRINPPVDGAINLYTGIYVYTIWIFLGDLIVFFAFHSLRTFAPQHIMFFFVVLFLLLLFFSSDISFNFRCFCATPTRKFIFKKNVEEQERKRKRWERERKRVYLIRKHGK